jgi:hypothetical protein
MPETARETICICGERYRRSALAGAKKDSTRRALSPKRMRDSDDRFSDREFRRALLEALQDGHPETTRPSAEGFLWIASALLFGANLLLILAVFLNLVGGLGPVTPSRLLWVALGTDLVGVGLLAWILWDAAGRIEGRSRVVRRVAALLLLAWIGLTATWRFALPAALGTNLQDLFTALLTTPVSGPTDVRANLSGMYELFGLWIAAAAVFVAAHILMAIARRAARPDDWVRGLPVYAWILGAGISLAATVSIVLSFLSVLAGRPLADNLNVWLVAKMIVAPNVFLSGYASSLDLGRRIRSVRASISSP